MIDPALVARVRAEVAAGIDPAGLLAVYAEPARRALLRERVRAAARAPLTEAELDAMCAELFGFGPVSPHTAIASNTSGLYCSRTLMSIPPLRVRRTSSNHSSTNRRRMPMSDR